MFLSMTNAKIITLKPRQTREKFPDDFENSIFFDENCGILIQIAQQHVSHGNGPVNINPALVQTMPLRRPR